MDWIFVGATLLVAFSALGDWRRAIYTCVLLDVARDFVRKMTPGYPVTCTVVIGIVWAAALLGASSADSRELKTLYLRYPRFRTLLTCLSIAVIPGAVISLVRYENGWLLAGIGAISYLAPTISILLGYLWPRASRDISNWIKLYIVVNSIALVGTLLEFYHFDFPGLGGMKMDWIRNHGEDVIKLICGFYRSPDVMGLHAAHVIMFATMLGLRQSEKWKGVWWSMAAWAAIGLLLSGRRKMIVMPILFLGTYATVHWTAGKHGKKVAFVSMGFGAAVAAGLFVLLQFQDSSDEYSDFATSIATEGVERAGKSFSSIVEVTVQQSGWLGDGLGSATQGKQHTGIDVGKSWQEDGVGRLFKELGIPGVILVVSAGLNLVACLIAAIRSLPPAAVHARELQIGMLGIVVANAASFIVSHQAYSGDPSTVLIVGFCLGMVLGMPRIWFSLPSRSSA